MNYDKIHIDDVLDRYIPKVVSEQYPTLRLMYKYYYEWLAQEGNPYYESDKLQDNLFIDSMDDKFISYMFNDMCHNFPELITDERFTIKTIRDFYKSKTIKDSILYLNKILFGGESSLFLPSEFLAKSSNGKYSNYSVVNTEDEVDFNLIGNIVNYNGTKYLVLNIVKKVSDNSYFEISLSEVRDGAIFADLIITPINTVGELVIDQPGINYKVDDLINIQGNSSFYGYVKKIKNGEILDLTIINGGTDYQIGDTIFLDNSYNLGTASKFLVKNVDGNGSITEVELLLSGFNFTEVPTPIIFTDNGVGAEFEIIHNIGRIDSVEIVNNGLYVDSGQDVVITTIDGTGADLSYVISDIAHISNNEVHSSVSDNYKLQDSYRWQDFSYILRTTVDLSQSTSNKLTNYREQFLDIIHPAGQEFFSELILKDSFSMEFDSSIYSDDSENILEFLLFFYTKQSDSYKKDHLLFDYRNTILDDIKNMTLAEFISSQENSSLIYDSEFVIVNLVDHQTRNRISEMGDQRIIEER